MLFQRCFPLRYDRKKDLHSLGLHSAEDRTSTGGLYSYVAWLVLLLSVALLLDSVNEIKAIKNEKVLTHFTKTSHLSLS